MRTVARRLERLEQRAALATKAWIHTVRILMVHPQNGCTGAMVMETGKPTTRVEPTPEEIEHVRADLEKRRAGRSELPTDLRSTESCGIRADGLAPDP